MSILGLYLMPHPPIVIPEVGRGEESKIKLTSESLSKIGKEISEKAPDTLVLITPHGTMFQDALALAYEDSLSGSLKQFRASGVSMKLEVNKTLTNKIYELSSEKKLPAVMLSNSLLKKYNTTLELDHGAMVPLYFINKHYSNYKVVHITYAPISDIDLYSFGMIIAKAVKRLRENAVIIASGDLSHRLKEDGPYEYSPLGEKFDKEFLHYLQQGDVKGLFSMDTETVCSAGECGRRSMLIMLGALEGKKFNGELLSYEGTFGVGYGVMRFNVLGEGVSMLEELEHIKKSRYASKANQKDPYVRLARESLTHYLTTGTKLQEIPDYVTSEMRDTKRGVFVSLKKHGELRGCIGTVLPTSSNIAREIISNAVEAGTSDPRFHRVDEDELLELDFSVDVLTEPEPASREDLNPKVYGVVVSKGNRRGLLLPDLDTVDTVEKQISIALEKGGIPSKEGYKIERFEVIRHKEEN
jgi:MEMO1 family protein